MTAATVDLDSTLIPANPVAPASRFSATIGRSAIGAWADSFRPDGPPIRGILRPDGPPIDEGLRPDGPPIDEGLRPDGPPILPEDAIEAFGPT
jgi:hypothetical protein